MKMWLALVWLAAAQSAPSFTIVPGERFGRITESSTRAQLNNLFGAAAVADGQVHIAEGFCTSGTIVFAKTPNEIEITWQDKQKTRVALVRTRSRTGSWRTPRGVRVGMLLTELERMAGSVLTVGGFFWDYGGGMTWKESGGELGLRLSPNAEDNRGDLAAYQSADIVGDQILRSDHPIVRRLKIRVEEIAQAWGGEFDQFDCR